ncbi:MAG: type II toxin-antitoxin system VapC family toxin [Asticcacaulis sp.]
MNSFDITIAPADESVAEQVTFAYRTWGKGYHPARLNLVDCFSYALARSLNCPLLFVGDDFSQTDIQSAL